MKPIIVELIGIVATVIILVSMLFKTTSVKGSIIMRSINIVGSVVFVVYGCLVPAISTAILNCALVIVNTCHLVMLLKANKTSEQNEQ